MLLTQCARRQFQLSSGDISTAFLQGNHSEISKDIFGAPPPEVYKMLNMKEHEILRITKAIYGLLNAPKQWFESLSSFLIEDGWIPHGLDKCLYTWVEDGVIQGVLGIHVDDVLCGGKGKPMNQPSTGSKIVSLLGLGRMPKKPPSHIAV